MKTLYNHFFLNLTHQNSICLKKEIGDFLEQYFKIAADNEDEIINV